ncbi:YjgN family protein [Simplicispira sedimenti]|uniref:YjgN family protein n=1 Tax=Simplicispira sedimenti TaxID=2919500 RepID=UPI001FAA07C2|nr:YjgN family protein [Acidovorax sp. W1-6]
MEHPPRSNASAQAAPLESAAIDAHPLEFSGRGGEYFRVWIVNILLSIVTLGLYTPWARRRTVQYFYGHTLVADSPLEFTAPQRKMVTGFVLLVLLTLAYNIAVDTGQDTAVALLLLGGAVLAPYLWASAMRFRLGNTRWRGLRLRFAASWREVYSASWPVFAIALVWIGVVFGLRWVAPELAQALDGATPDGDEKSSAMPALPPALWALLLLGVVLSLLFFIRLEYNYQSLLVLRTHLGAEAGRWKPVYMDFVKIWLATVGVFLLCVLGMVALVTLAAGGSVALLAGLGKNAGVWVFFLFLFGLFALFMLLLLASAPARAYREARMFLLQWNNIGVSQVARFRCTLSVRGFVWLRVRNLLLTLLTLGFYRPFARVSEYAMKLESVTLHVKGGVDQLAGQMLRHQEGGLGDALADAAGLDLIG